MSTRTTGRVAQGAHRPRKAAGAALALVALTVAGYADAPSASAYPVYGRAVTATADNGTAAVIGTITVKATPAGSPAGAAVTLTEIPASGNSLSRTVKADSRGGYRFDGLAGGADWTYSVAATYSGTTFESDSVQVAAGKVVDVPLTLYASTKSAADVTQPTWDVWIDVTATGLAVQQDVGLTNKGTAAYTGSQKVPDAPAGLDLAAFSLPITEQADALEFLGRFQACCSYVKGATWTHTRPISPGSSTGTLRYETPSVPQLTFPVALPTQSFRLFAPESLTIASSQLTRQGTSTDKGVTYNVYAASSALKPGTVVTVSITGAPSESSGPAWGVVAAVAVVLVLALVAITLLARRRAAARTAETPQVAAASPTSTSKAEGGAKPGSGTGGSSAATSAVAKSGKPAKPAKPAKPTTSAGAAAAAAASVTTAKPAAKAAPTPETEKAEPVAPERAPTTVTTATARTRADELTDELATLDLAWENGTITDERAYRRIRESLVAQLVAEVGGDA